MVEEAQVVVHEGHQPDFIGDFLDADVLTGKDRAEVDLAAAEADAAALGDGDRAIVQRVLELAEAAIGTGEGAVELGRVVEIIEDDLPVQNKVSRIWGDTKGRATSRDCALVLARVDGDPDLSRMEIEWDEPYKDGGPDAAHKRFRYQAA